ncbi:MAG TPA: glycosyl hydrolase family 28 protein, partial [Candidatus Binatia bacterium]|nr:glycosyl hydrolase family 28 protein [Candidatus Binatia bacterium]
IAYATPPQPVIPNETNNVTNFGAVGDGVTTNTAAIQAAINALAVGPAHGGTVEIPPGVYLSGPLYLSNSINLQIDAGATLEMLPYGSYPSTADFISGANLHDIEISGSGTIDGQGADWWTAYNSSQISRPKAMFAATACSNVLVRDVTLQNPPNTHISFRFLCRNVTVNHINIETPLSPNTDGIDCSGANVLIENSHISDGDDHVALGDGHVGYFNHDITVANCLLGNGHGISIGSYTTAGLSNLLVMDCVWTNGSTGIRIKADIDRGGPVQDLKYYNLTMTNVQTPIYFYSYYTNSGTSSGVTFDQAASYPVFPVSSTTPIWRDIVISNLTAFAASGRSAGILWGRPEMCISNVVLDHVNITASKYFEIYNARGIQLIDSKVTT